MISLLLLQAAAAQARDIELNINARARSVTIEKQGDARLTARAGDRLNREVLSRFSDVRGIRIEDDVLVTPDGHEVLTAAIPREVADVEAAVLGA